MGGSKINKELLYSLWVLTNAGQLTKATYNVIRAFPSFEAAYKASPADFDTSLFSEKDIAKLSIKDTKKAESIISFCEQNGIKPINYYDDEYPALLRQIYNPPLVLFVKGELPRTDITPSITIIGTRNCSKAHGKFAAKLAHDLALSGFIIVSGIASGIDTYAQKGALLAKKPNIIILPCGIDVLYSKESKDLYFHTLKKGAIISEYLPQTKAYASSFEARNRLLSGITHGTVIVETSETGGSMITMRHALDQGKSVFAVPGSPTEMTNLGTNALLREGAILCDSAKDIINEYNTFSDEIKSKIKNSVVTMKQFANEKYDSTINENKEKSENVQNLSENEKKVYLALSSATLSADELVEKLSISFSEIISILQKFELMDYAEALKGGFYKIK